MTRINEYLYQQHTSTSYVVSNEDYQADNDYRVAKTQHIFLNMKSFYYSSGECFEKLAHKDVTNLELCRTIASKRLKVICRHQHNDVLYDMAFQDNVSTNASTNLDDYQQVAYYEWLQYGNIQKCYNAVQREFTRNRHTLSLEQKLESGDFTVDETQEDGLLSCELDTMLRQELGDFEYNVAIYMSQGFSIRSIMEREGCTMWKVRKAQDEIKKTLARLYPLDVFKSMFETELAN